MLEFSGAKNNMFIARNGQISELNSDKMGIGHIFEGLYKLNTAQLQQNDMLYLYTDGYKDQKGGLQNRCFLALNFANLLQEICHLEPLEQEKILKNKHEQWKAKNEQTDDICVVGIHVW